MGSHTDYNLGYVLTVAINRDTWMAARPTSDETVRLYAANLDVEDWFTLTPILRSSSKRWSNYIRGVASIIREAGFHVPGIDAVIHSTVPLESGLGSSAALECVAAVVFRELGGWTIERERMARLCQIAENRFVGVNCGILDQYSSFLGEEHCGLLLDCRDLSSRPIPIAAGIRVIICDTRAPRQLSGVEYAERRAQCEEGASRLGVSALRDVSPCTLEAQAGKLSASTLKRCRFIVTENERVLRMAKALIAGDRTSIGCICAESFVGARDLYEICTPHMLAMMEAMLAAPGVIGARQAGAGFGGCMVALVDEEQTENFRAAVAGLYANATGIRPEIYAVEPAAGAGLLNRNEVVGSADQSATRRNRDGDARDLPDVAAPPPDSSFPPFLH
jgi:galactokinase